MLKHKAMEASTSAAPAKKKLLTQFEPVKIGPIYSLEEMDMKVLQFQNKKLAERIEQRRKAEDELRRRIEQLEQRQTTDDAVLCIVNRYWNQLDEDVRVLLQRFDAEGADESGKQNESKAVTAFLTLLSQWDKPEIEDKLRQRVEFSERAIGKLLQAYDRLLQRNEKLWEAIKDKADEAETTTTDVNKSDADIAMETDEKPEVDVKKEEDGEVSSGETGAIKKESDIKKEAGTEGADKKEEVNKKVFVLAEALREEMERLMAENKRVQDTVTELSQAHHETTLKNSELSDKLAAAETEVAELRNQVEELEYNLQRAESRVDKLDRHLANTTSKLATYQEGAITVQGGGEGVSKNKFNELVAELEEQRELATNRLGEMEKLNTEHQEALKDVEKLKLDLSSLPESVIVESTEYKCLQSQFSVLYNESMQMKTQLEEARNLLASSKNTHLRQIEQMESDELMCQKKLRTDVIQLEDQLAQVRREYELLRMEFEQTLAANEQTGPINREMRNLISSLKNHNEQLKGETARYKRKLREAHTEINKLKVEQQQQQQQQQDQHHTHHPGEPPHSASSHHHHHHHSHSHHHPAGEGDHPGSASQDSASGSKSDPDAGDVEIVEPMGDKEKGRSHDSDNIRELKMELKKSQDRERDMKMLLDVYKTAPKETRDKAQLMMSEKKYRSEIEELKRDVRRLQEFERRERRRLGEDEAMRKIKKQDELISELQKKIQAQKQEEDTLLSEMEVTGQAFEDMQEQNIRLLQQLREKDDANFKLMSERIKSNQIHKLLREEKEVLVEQVETIQTQVEAQNQVVRRLEEKEQILQNNLATVEKELALRQQAMEQHKRKAVESAQTAADLKLHLDKYHSQLKEAQNLVSDKTEALQSQAFKYKRIQEDVASSRRKLERAKKIEQAASADEVLLEEIREYKEQLTCPSCKVKKKDAVLTKCFHVFCLECLRTRYETRQRKCPKCNATFGANDYHRIYLE